MKIPTFDTENSDGKTVVNSASEGKTVVDPASEGKTAVESKALMNSVLSQLFKNASIIFNT